MKKYLIYRTTKGIDKEIKNHELIGIEYGDDIYAATDAIMRAVSDDLSENPEYAGCEVTACAPEEVDPNLIRTKRYQYETTGLIMPPHASKGSHVDYGIVEQESTEE